LHINHLELLAALFGLKCFASNLFNCNVLCRIDNTTAISYINRMGSIQHTGLNNIARAIWLFCEQRNIYVFASYIKSAENEIADRESRQLEIDTEWELSYKAYKKIIDTLGTPEVDISASRINKKCEKYISWLRDPEALLLMLSQLGGQIFSFTVSHHFLSY